MEGETTNNSYIQVLDIMPKNHKSPKCNDTESLGREQKIWARINMKSGRIIWIVAGKVRTLGTYIASCKKICQFVGVGKFA